MYTVVKTLETQIHGQFSWEWADCRGSGWCIQGRSSLMGLSESWDCCRGEGGGKEKGWSVCWDGEMATGKLQDRLGSPMVVFGLTSRNSSDFPMQKVSLENHNVAIHSSQNSQTKTREAKQTLHDLTCVLSQHIFQPSKNKWSSGFGLCILCWDLH